MTSNHSSIISVFDSIPLLRRTPVTGRPQTSSSAKLLQPSLHVSRKSSTFPNLAGSQQRIVYFEDEVAPEGRKPLKNNRRTSGSTSIRSNSAGALSDGNITKGILLSDNHDNNHHKMHNDNKNANNNGEKPACDISKTSGEHSDPAEGSGGASGTLGIKSLKPKDNYASVESEQPKLSKNSTLPSTDNNLPESKYKNSANVGVRPINGQESGVSFSEGSHNDCYVTMRRVSAERVSAPYSEFSPSATSRPLLPGNTWQNAPPLTTSSKTTPQRQKLSFSHVPLSQIPFQTDCVPLVRLPPHLPHVCSGRQRLRHNELRDASSPPFIASPVQVSACGSAVPQGDTLAHEVAPGQEGQRALLSPSTAEEEEGEGPAPETKERETGSEEGSRGLKKNDSRDPEEIINEVEEEMKRTKNDQLGEEMKSQQPIETGAECDTNNYVDRERDNDCDNDNNNSRDAVLMIENGDVSRPVHVEGTDNSSLTDKEAIGKQQGFAQTVVEPQEYEYEKRKCSQEEERGCEELPGTPVETTGAPCVPPEGGDTHCLVVGREDGGKVTEKKSATEAEKNQIIKMQQEAAELAEKTRKEEERKREENEREAKKRDAEEKRKEQLREEEAKARERQKQFIFSLKQEELQERSIVEAEEMKSAVFLLERETEEKKKIRRGEVERAEKIRQDQQEADKQDLIDFENFAKHKLEIAEPEISQGNTQTEINTGNKYKADAPTQHESESDCYSKKTQGSLYSAPRSLLSVRQHHPSDRTKQNSCTRLTELGREKEGCEEEKMGVTQSKPLLDLGKGATLGAVNVSQASSVPPPPPPVLPPPPRRISQQAAGLPSQGPLVPLPQPVRLVRGWSPGRQGVLSPGRGDVTRGAGLRSLSPPRLRYGLGSETIVAGTIDYGAALRKLQEERKDVGECHDRGENDIDINGRYNLSNSCLNKSDFAGRDVGGSFSSGSGNYGGALSRPQHQLLPGQPASLSHDPPLHPRGNVSPSRGRVAESWLAGSLSQSPSRVAGGTTTPPRGRTAYSFPPAPRLEVVVSRANGTANKVFYIDIPGITFGSMSEAQAAYKLVAVQIMQKVPEYRHKYKKYTTVFYCKAAVDESEDVFAENSDRICGSGSRESGGWRRESEELGGVGYKNGKCFGKYEEGDHGCGEDADASSPAVAATRRRSKEAAVRSPRFRRSPARRGQGVSPTTREWTSWELVTHQDVLDMLRVASDPTFEAKLKLVLN